MLSRRRQLRFIIVCENIPRELGKQDLLRLAFGNPFSRHHVVFDKGCPDWRALHRATQDGSLQAHSLRVFIFENLQGMDVSIVVDFAGQETASASRNYSVVPLTR